VWLDGVRGRIGRRPSIVGGAFPAVAWQPIKRKMSLMIFSFLAGGGRGGGQALRFVVLELS